VTVGGELERPSSLEERPDGDRLLRRVATRLGTQARDYVPKTFGGRAGDIPSPIGQFIRAQHAVDAESFHLPEPLLGPVPEATVVLVVGLNPGYGPTEDIPRLGTALDEYVEWYAHRMNQRDEHGRPCSNFEGKRGVIHHYAAVERDYLTPVLQKEALGRTAVYADAIPWKWNADSNPDFGQTAIVEYAQARLAEIATVLQPSLVMTLGQRVAGFVSLWPDADPRPSKLRLGEWTGDCLPCFHPNKHWKTGEKLPYFERAHVAMRSALGWEPGERS
jgi:hypothetical protein